MRSWILAAFLARAVAPLPAWCAPVAVGAAGQDPPLFSSHDPLALTLTADLEALDGDRRASPDREALLSFADGVGNTVELPIIVRTRGSFRRDPANCSFPPLRLDLAGVATGGTVFEGQGELKVVSSCRPERSSYDELVVKEYLAYRSVLLITDHAFRVRPLALTLVDREGREPAQTRPAFLIEADDALASRLGATVFDLEEGKNLPASAFDPISLVRAGLVEYMVGGTDWSDVAGHNVEILDRGGVAVAVPYDFDMTGLVDPPYATTNPDFGLSSVRERYYRGWCQSRPATRAALDAFRSAREEILGLWASYPALAADTRARATRYLEDFFTDIETDERAEQRVLRDCRSAG